MAPRLVSISWGFWLLVPGQRGARIRLPLLQGIRRPCWTGICHFADCGVKCGNERVESSVLQLGRPIVNEL